MISVAPTPLRSAFDTAADLARVERHKSALDGLVAMGMDLAGMLHRRAGLLDRTAADVPDAAAEGVAALTEVTVAFDRVARAVRRTVSLARLLETPVTAAPVVPAGRDRVAVRARVIRAVEDAIHDDVPERERAEDLRAELFERIDAPEFDDVLTGRPVEEVILEIRRDLGIAGMPGYATPWVRRRPSVVAALHARARGEVTGPEAIAAERARPAVDRVSPAAGGVLPASAEADLEGLALRLVGARRGRGPP